MFLLGGESSTYSMGENSNKNGSVFIGGNEDQTRGIIHGGNTSIQNSSKSIVQNEVVFHT